MKIFQFGIVASEDLKLDTPYKAFKFVIGNTYLHDKMVKTNTTIWRDRCKWWKCKLYFSKILKDFSKNCYKLYDRQGYDNEIIKNDVCICNDCKCEELCLCSKIKMNVLLHKLIQISKKSYVQEETN